VSVDGVEDVSIGEDGWALEVRGNTVVVGCLLIISGSDSPTKRQKL
jgi:hypothetical protein